MYKPIEQLEVFGRACSLADELFVHVEKWSRFRQDTVGMQLCRAADSIGANLVEGDSRTSSKESIRFFDFSRGSCREVRYWLGRCKVRGLLPEELVDRLILECETVGKMITGLLGHRRETLGVVKEPTALYDQESEL